MITFHGHPRTGIGLRPGDVLLVLHDFNARTSDELTLRKSERVELIELDDGFGDGWYLGRHLTRGGTGLFPGVYTTKAPATGRSAYQANLVREQSPAQPPSYSPRAAADEELAKTQSPTNPQTNPPTETAGQPPSHGYSHSRESTRSSLPASYASHVPAVQRSIGEALDSNDRGNEDSTVMNETLSVIDEHITDLSTPRQSLAPPPATINEDSESEYSRDLDRQSYVAGPETDDEENDKLTESSVRKWDHKKTAQYLRSVGVDSAHCDIFEEQEISGDVLLDMDQSFIHMKEYNFGVMGRRLKTWHKIREVQDEVKTGHKLRKQSTFSSVEKNSSTDDMSRSSSRVTTGSNLLPRIPGLMEKPGLSLRHSQPTSPFQDDLAATPAPLQPGIGRASLGNNTPPSPWRSSMVGDGTTRPSAAMIRELTHSRRHSSIDYNKQSDPAFSAFVAAPSPSIHQNKGSMDRGWTMSGSLSAKGTPQLQSAPVRSQGALDLATSPQELGAFDADDRGYFSGNEVDKRIKSATLRKRETGATASHSRRVSNAAPVTKRHSRLSSMDSIKDGSGNSSAAKAYHSSGYKGRLRSASARGFSVRSLPSGTTPPAVTNLEKEGMVGPSPRSSAASTLVSMQNKAMKFIGIRAASENLSQSEKTPASRNDASVDGSSRASPLASPTGSTTPSLNSHSLDYDNPDSARKAGEMPGYAALPKSTARARVKGKQETSAYTRGLLQVTPEEARKTCDYHGWMKKKSSSLMTTWKPRLFILRGRRLSYYYSENDTEERGIIDISSHKVLVANHDAMVTLHAQLTGATSPATDPSSAEPSPRVSSGIHASTIPFYYRKVSAAQSDPRTQDGPVSADSTPATQPTSPANTGTPFYFKLVPPKSGFSRAVQFTKPAVHYFQVDSVAEGRKWMGELMKATIEHDWTSLETTNKQKTISLAKARARGERPRALLGEDIDKTSLPHEPDVLPDIPTTGEDGGLNISGLELQPSEVPPSQTSDTKDSKADSGVGEAGEVIATEATNEAPKAS